jgi:hypothetical protein
MSVGDSRGKPVKIDPALLKRSKTLDSEDGRRGGAKLTSDDGRDGSVSAGPIDKVIELAFNPTREKLKEVTIIDRMQGRTFPLIDTMSTLFLDCIKIAFYRQSPVDYRELFDEEHPPIMFDLMGEYLYRTAQWQKSIAGKNLERATDIALAETEKEAGEEDKYPGTAKGYED